MARKTESIIGIDGFAQQSWALSSGQAPTRRLVGIQSALRCEVSFTDEQRVLFKRARREFLASPTGLEFIDLVKSSWIEEAKALHKRALDESSPGQADMFGTPEFVPNEGRGRPSTESYLDLDAKLAEIEAKAVPASMVTPDVLKQYAPHLWEGIFFSKVVQQTETASTIDSDFAIKRSLEKDRNAIAQAKLESEVTIRTISAVCRSVENSEFASLEAAEDFLSSCGFTKDQNKQNRYVCENGDRAILTMH